ncbi:MAG TPA: NUDIX domain-containing protein [Candidatus Polarisedimenticolia bacterium]|jgi:predicted NUDIX family NTP pyrophosphohydrolase|nr:NUDIX domain-containing protein [Candidatus Polarisedimenticolia bacterium]
MPKRSAGLLLYRNSANASGPAASTEVLLVHPGGPFWTKKDAGAWSIPKGLIEEGEDPLAAARREFEEETGGRAEGEAIPLQPLRQPGGKIVQAWAVRGDFDPATLRSSTFAMEWPPKSGRQQEFPEVDRAGWFTLPAAREKILAGQRDFLEQLERLLDSAGP